MVGGAQVSLEAGTFRLRLFDDTDVDHMHIYTHTGHAHNARGVSLTNKAPIIVLAMHQQLDKFSESV